MFSNFRRNFLALSIAASMLFLAGCGDDPNQINAEVNQNVTSTLNHEQTQLKQWLAQMKAVDPSVQDIYYGVDSHGNKVLHIVRKNDDTVPIANNPLNPNNEFPVSASTSFLATASSSYLPYNASTFLSNNNSNGTTDTTIPLLANNQQGTYTNYSWNLGNHLFTYMIIAHLLSSHSFSNVVRTYPTTSYVSNLTKDNLRKQKNTTAYAYNGWVTSTTRTAYNASRSGSSFFSSSGGDESVASGSRSGGVFSGSSARAGGYSAGE